MVAVRSLSPIATQYCAVAGDGLPKPASVCLDRDAVVLTDGLGDLVAQRRVAIHLHDPLPLHAVLGVERCM